MLTPIHIISDGYTKVLFCWLIIFQSVVVYGIVEKYLYVILMQSLFQRVTLDHIEFHLPISFPLSKASEVFLQGQTVLKWIYVHIQGTVVCKQAN